jgi:hypothetical protein
VLKLEKGCAKTLGLSSDWDKRKVCGNAGLVKQLSCEEDIKCI